MTPLDILEQIENDHPLPYKLIKRQEYLCTGGSINTNIYFIKSGCLRIFITDGDEERTIRFGYQNNIIVALDSFLSGKPSDFYIQAIRKSEVILLSKERFNSFLQTHPEFSKIWINILEDLVLQQIEREKDLLIQSPIERYNRVLKRSPHLFQEVPHKYIANYLRMTPETLSRLKNS